MKTSDVEKVYEIESTSFEDPYEIELFSQASKIASNVKGKGIWVATANQTQGAKKKNFIDAKKIQQFFST